MPRVDLTGHVAPAVAAVVLLAVAALPLPATARTAVILGALLPVVRLAHLSHRASRRVADVARREAALAEQRAALVQSVSHEFRTPLTVIRGTVETLSRRPHLVQPAGRDLMNSLERATARLEELVAVVLTAAEADDVGLRDDEELVRLDAVIEGTLERLGSAKEYVLLDVDPDANVLVIRPAHVQLLLRSVLDNAVRHSAGAPVDVTITRWADQVVIRVADRGPGLPAAVRDRAFEPFLQGHSVGAGLGLGLTAARRLAQRLGGSVELHDRPGGGLVVEVRLPQRRASDQAGVVRPISDLDER